VNRNKRTFWRLVAIAIAGALALTLGFYVASMGGESGPKPLTNAQRTTEPRDDRTGAPRALTPEQRDSREAHQAINDNPAHFKCGDYPEGEKLSRADVVPTGNIVVVIEFDKSTGTYKVTQNDQRVAIKHTVENKISHELATPQPYTDDKFTWEFTDNTLVYGVYKEYLGGEGMTWSSGDIYSDKSDMILANRSNGANNPRYVIVGTDPDTCKFIHGTAPAGMWNSLTDSGLNLPQFTS
jgi:hypothetical protein